MFKSLIAGLKRRQQTRTRSTRRRLKVEELDGRNLLAANVFGLDFGVPDGGEVVSSDSNFVETSRSDRFQSDRTEFADGSVRESSLTTNVYQFDGAGSGGYGDVQYSDWLSDYRHETVERDYENVQFEDGDYVETTNVNTDVDSDYGWGTWFADSHGVREAEGFDLRFDSDNVLTTHQSFDGLYGFEEIVSGHTEGQYGDMSINVIGDTTDTSSFVVDEVVTSGSVSEFAELQDGTAVDVWETFQFGTVVTTDQFQNVTVEDQVEFGYFDETVETRRFDNFFRVETTFFTDGTVEVSETRSDWEEVTEDQNSGEWTRNLRPEPLPEFAAEFVGVAEDLDGKVSVSFDTLNTGIENASFELTIVSPEHVFGVAPGACGYDGSAVTVCNGLLAPIGVQPYNFTLRPLYEAAPPLRALVTVTATENNEEVGRFGVAREDAIDWNADGRVSGDVVPVDEALLEFLGEEEDELFLPLV